MNGNPLNREQISALVAGDPPLVEDWVDLDSQLQPNGFDLSLLDVSRLLTPGAIGASDSERELASVEPLSPATDGWLELAPGPYLITFNEVLHLPQDLMALGRPRSSLLRSGVSLHTAVWDAGYHGRSQSLLTVHHTAGFRLQLNARLAQLVFFRLGAPTERGYEGRYQDENL